MHFYRHLPIIQAMSFDLDDTLYDNYPVISGLEQRLIDWLHTHHPVTASRSLAWWKQEKLTLAEHNPLLIHDVTRWRFAQIEQGLTKLGYLAEDAQHTAQEAIDLVLEWRNKIDVPQQTHHVLQALKDQIPLIAITNGNADPYRFGLGGYFECILKAGPDGLAKPEIDLFVQGAESLGLPISSILHVGDDLRTDVYGAKRSGMAACWYNDKNHLLFRQAQVSTLPDVEITQLSDLLQIRY
jgi:FMN hydrolase / 5-amino-6-(5-phospho-D-ribitylamino)uracil phosphatase